MSVLNIDHIINDDPKKIIEYIKYQKEINHIDFIRVQFNNAGENINVVRSYFRNTSNVKLQELNKKQKPQAVWLAVLSYCFVVEN